METSGTIAFSGDIEGGVVDDSCYTDDRQTVDGAKAEASNHVDAGSNSTVDDAETNNMTCTFLDGTMMIGGDPTTILSSKGRENGSVISAMTDLNSLEGPTLPSLLGEEETSSQRSCDGRYKDDNSNNNNNDIGIPKQVILPQDDLVLHYATHNDDDFDRNVNSVSPLIPTSSPTSDTGGTHSHHPPSHPTITADMDKNTTRHLREFSDHSVNDATATTAPSTLISQPTKDNTPPNHTIPTEDEAADDDQYDENNIALDEYIRSPEVQNAIVERSPGGRYVRFLEKLGSGASKDVYRAYDTQEGIEVAWNVVNLSGVPKSERNRIVNEVRLLERLHHQNIISFHGSWVNRERQEVNFVTEILSSGTLKSFINKVQVIRWKIAKRWAFQILKGLEYLHSQDPPVIHRDLKCENIFINGTSGDLRIGDLGLSTVHRNGKVLSVLGTPEFMAPDMYEEDSYDEKVDIYAFGMCLLEIFTKEIPYSECSNPAQIYKKVIAGEPPEVLSRLQSRHARDFVLLCLGYRDENGKYIRPPVSELLQHPFLEKRANDDDEVVVDLPPRQGQQDLVPEPTTGGTPLMKRRVSTHSSQTLHHQNNSSTVDQTHSRDSSLIGESNPISPSDVTPKHSRNNSLKPTNVSSPQEDEDDGDRFEEMQESEINMKKVKVLMGRGQELKDDDEVPSTGISTVGISSLQDSSSNERNIGLGSTAPKASDQAQEPTASSTAQNAAQNSSESAEDVSPPFNYIVSAAVVENENPNIRPYDDDILQLIVTLPVDGQSNYVLFDFHLIEDEPIQVAKEMVKELGIPQGAVLEISETISGIARNARIKQEKYTAKLQALPIVPTATRAISYPTQPQGQVHQQILQQETIHHTQDQKQILSTPDLQTSTNYNSVQSTSLVQPQQVAQYYPGQQPSTTQQLQQNITTPSLELQSEPLRIPGADALASSVQRQEQIMQPQVVPLTSIQGHIQSTLVNGTTTGQNMQRSVQPNLSHSPLQDDFTRAILPDGQISLDNVNIQSMYPSLPQAQPTVELNQSISYPTHHINQTQSSGHHQDPQQLVIPSGNLTASTQSISLAINSTRDGKSLDGRPPIQSRQRSSGSDKSLENPAISVNTVPAQTRQISTMDTSVPPQSQRIQPQNVPTMNQGSLVATPLTLPAQATILTAQVPTPLVATQAITTNTGKDEATKVETLQPVEMTHRNSSAEFIMSSDVLASSVVESEGDSDDEDDVDIAEELRKLDEDFQKNLERAAKVYANRMDNLQRSQIEREAQHLKTLEKHERERAEFEKRLAQEAEQQQRRIEQLQREWDKKRETVAIQKKKQRDSLSGSTSEQQSDMSLGHLRTVSATSSNFSLSPAMSVHKQQHENGENGHNDR